MREEFKLILHSLDHKNALVRRIEEGMIDILERHLDLEPFIEHLSEEIRLASDPHGDQRPFYHFLLAIAYLTLNESEKAKNSLAHAVQGFRISGFYLDEALSEWLFAMIHIGTGNNIRAERACETALAILNRLINDLEAESRYEKASQHTQYRIQIENLLESIKSLPPVEVKATSEDQHSLEHESYIVLPWLPKYDSVQAGPNGIIWVDPPTKNSSVIHIIEIDGTPCEVFSTSSSARAQNQQITLVRGIDYGWAKVMGDSMNASQPIPIEEGDYVLFSKQWNQDVDSIVIACQVLTEHESTHMVKKYVAKDFNLVSETTDTAQDYSPIPLNEDYQILGTVIAVAKPKH